MKKNRQSSTIFGFFRSHPGSRFFTIKLSFKAKSGEAAALQRHRLVPPSSTASESTGD